MSDGIRVRVGGRRPELSPRRGGLPGRRAPVIFWGKNKAEEARSSFTESIFGEALSG